MKFSGVDGGCGVKERLRREYKEPFANCIYCRPENVDGE
jgi:hypothetical protein